MIQPIAVARQYKNKFPDFVGTIGVLKCRRRTMFPVLYLYQVSANRGVKRISENKHPDVFFEIEDWLVRVKGGE